MFALLLLASIIQETPAPVATPAPPVEKPKKERPICRPIQNTVSRMGAGRECHTAAEWRAMGDGVDGHELDRLRDASTGSR